jgi:hypothetical protein
LFGGSVAASVRKGSNHSGNFIFLRNAL